VHKVNYLALIGMTVGFICLVIAVKERQNYNFPEAQIGLCAGFFTLSCLLLAHRSGEQMLSVGVNTTQMQSLALQNSFNWVASPSTTNAIIAVICMLSCLIFFILQFVGLKTKKIMMGLTVIVASIYFLEIFFILLLPEQSALRVGWYKGAVEYLSYPSLQYLEWLLIPLKILALVELWLSVTYTLGFAVAICLGLSFGVDYIRSKVGI
jgi:hypothetical protein